MEPQLGPSVGTLYFGHSGKHYVALKPKQRVPLVTFMCYMYGKQMCLGSFQNLGTCYIRFLTINQPVWLAGSSVHSSDRFFWCDSCSLGYVRDIFKYTVVLRYWTFSHFFQASTQTSSYAMAVKSSKGNSEQRTCSFPPTIKHEESAQEIKKCSSDTFIAKRKTTAKVQYLG